LEEDQKEESLGGSGVDPPPISLLLRQSTNKRLQALSFNVFTPRLTRSPAMPHPRSPSLLSPANYDNDAASLRSPSEQDSDSDDDEFLRHPRSTLELSQHDRSVLEDEDELEKLLTRTGPALGLRRIFSPNGSSVRIGKRERRRARREARLSRRERVSEEGELMYEMEEGLGDDDTSSLMSGSSMDLDGKEDYLYEPVHRRSTLPWTCYSWPTNTCLSFFSHPNRHGAE
jgi:hypothetical protein